MQYQGRKKRYLLGDSILHPLGTESTALSAQKKVSEMVYDDLLPDRNVVFSSEKPYQH